MIRLLSAVNTAALEQTLKKEQKQKKKIPKINKPPPLQCLYWIRIKCKHGALPHFIFSFLKARGRTRTIRTRTGTRTNRTRARTLGPGVLCPVVLVVVLVVLVVVIRPLISPRIRTKQKKCLLAQRV